MPRTPLPKSRIDLPANKHLQVLNADRKSAGCTVFPAQLKPRLREVKACWPSTAGGHRLGSNFGFWRYVIMPWTRPSWSKV